MKKLLPLSLCFSSLLLAETSSGDLNLRKDSLCADRALNNSIRDFQSQQRSVLRVDNLKERENRVYAVNSMLKRRELLSK